MFVKRLQNAKSELKELGCEQMGESIIASKMEIFSFFIYHLKTPAANILKQEAIACGGDFALPKDAILYKKEFYDGVLTFTHSQSKALLKKLKMQPFGLKTLASVLESHLKEIKQEVQIMGIINATPDSFYEDSRKKGTQAQNEILAMIEEGANIIDIGGASSRPGSEWIDEKEELARIKPLVDFIKENALYKRVKFSIDTYTPKVAEFCLDNGFKIINDITGFVNKKMQEVVKGRDCECVIMHMKGSPKTMQENLHYENLFLEMDSFFARQIEILENQGNTNIILDVGIGFGKDLAHNCELIKNLAHFCHFGYPLLVGASRKSMIDRIHQSSTQERLPGTLALHLESIKNGARIIRCHDVKEHKQALKVWEAVQ